MSIANAEQRRNAVGPWGITPNVVTDREWRRQVAWVYAGLAGVQIVSSGSAVLSPVQSPVVSTARSPMASYPVVVMGV